MENLESSVIEELINQVTEIKKEVDLIGKKVKSDNYETAFNEVKKQVAILQAEINISIATIKSEISVIQQATSQNDSEIDALQIEAAKTHKPWYLDVSVLISFLALLFSFGTTAVSYYRVRQQDIHDARTELRGLLQRLSAIPKENVEIQKNHTADVSNLLLGMLNAESSLIANQADEVINRIPDHVSAIEYVVVAQALILHGNVGEAQKLFERAVSVARNPYEEFAAVRGYAQLLFTTGNPEAGREMFRRALNINEKYPTIFSYQLQYNNAETEFAWASSEYYIKQCLEAQKHMNNAVEISNKLIPSNKYYDSNQ
jgi:tetratricopeptide (TPR) repeat protein